MLGAMPVAAGKRIEGILGQSRGDACGLVPRHCAKGPAEGQADSRRIDSDGVLIALRPAGGWSAIVTAPVPTG
jgi:hypothetical protein